MAEGVGRRDFLKAVGAAGAVAATAGGAAAQDAGSEQQAQVPGRRARQPTPAHPRHEPRNAPPESTFLFLDSDEAAFITAAVDVLIPADETGPGAVEAGVVHYIDRQLKGAFGQGARLYRSGPYAEGTPQQGYQLPLTPAELYRTAIREILDTLEQGDGKPFDQLDPKRRNEVLAALQQGDMALQTVPGKVFFNMLLANTLEGYFGDPAYGGNRGMAVWRMIGFPGARGGYADEIAQYRGKPYTGEPVALADLQ